jgi:iron complex outermembrane recepter protein
MVWSQFNLPGDVDVDLMGRWISGIQGRFQSINGYFGLDVRVGWRPAAQWEIALVGQNLIESQHFEYVEDTGVRAQVTPVPRGGYLQITARF